MYLRVNNKEYDLGCDAGQEEHLRLLADDIDERVRSLVLRLGSNPGEALALLLVALTMADESFENKREIERLHNEVRRLEAFMTEGESGQRLREMEVAMADTLTGLAQRLEVIAGQIEMR